MFVHTKIPDEVVTNTGMRARNPKRNTNPMAFMWRTHHSCRSRSGTGRTVGDSDQPTSWRPLRTNQRTTTNTVTKNHTLTIDWLVDSTLARTSFSTTPTASPAQMTPGRERIRASNDTTSTLSSSSSTNRLPVSSTVAACTPWSGAVRIAVAAAKAPAMVHTIVDTRRGDVP